jgi:hypothetical protein
MKRIRTVNVEIKCEIWLRTTVQTNLTDNQIQELANEHYEAMDFFNEGLKVDGDWDLAANLGELPINIFNENGCYEIEKNVKNPTSYVWIEEVPTKT